MNGKIWIKKYFLVILIVVVIIEVIYNLKDHNRHYVDYIVNHLLPKIENRDVEILILGDSVAANAFGSTVLKNNILDLTSNQAISMAGNYFLLKRFLLKNKPPEKLFLFTIPQFYQNDLDQIWTYLYFETVFTYDEEVNEIKSIKPNLYTVKKPVDKYFESRRNVLLSSFNESKNERIKHQHVDINTVKNDLNYLSTKVTEKVQIFEKTHNNMKEIPLVYFNKIKNLCDENKIIFNVVIEPTPQRISKLFYVSEWYKFLINSNVNLYDVNKFYQFSDFHFQDGVHINGKINDYYLQLVDEKIIDVF